MKSAYQYSKSSIFPIILSLTLINSASFAQVPSNNSRFQSNYQSSQSSYYQRSEGQQNPNSKSYNSYYYPPYQVGLDDSIQVQFYSSNAESVGLHVRNSATNQEFSYPLTLSGDSMLWVGQVPKADFDRSQELELNFIPADKAGHIMADQIQSTRYITLNTPAYYSTRDIALPNLKVVSFQRNASSGPVFNVYWPELYYTRKISSPLAARVISSRSPENNIQKLEPVKGMSGWFELEVSTLWFSPGEEITVEFSSVDTQKANHNSNYVVGSNSDFIPQQTLQFLTLKNN